MKRRPSAYVAATFRLCQERNKALKKRLDHEKEQLKREAKRSFCFALLCVSCIPKHTKIDTETLVQLFIHYKEAVTARKEVLTRGTFND